ncbi:MAG: hypothetical protein AB1611_17735 [bacterium]
MSRQRKGVVSDQWSSVASGQWPVVRKDICRWSVRRSREPQEAEPGGG